MLIKLAAKGRSDADPAAVIETLTTRFAVSLPPEGLVLDALRLRKAHQVSYWDSLLLAACIDARVKRLYSEDVPGKPVIEGVEIVNPFA